MHLRTIHIRLDRYIQVLLSILFLTASSFLALSCDDKNENDGKEDGMAERTVIIYMSAENDLDSPSPKDYWTRDHDEILLGAKKLSNKYNLILYVDRSSSSQMPYISRVSSKGESVVRKYKTDDYASKPEVMEEALHWIVDKYPAKSYGLVMWGHGDGWITRDEDYAFAKQNTSLSASSTATAKRSAGTLGIAYDDGSNHANTKGAMWMNIVTFDKVLSTMPHLDFIFFDCCFMQSIEVAYELRNRCDYIIGSPAEIPGIGAPYNIVVKDFFLQKDILPKTIVDDYFNNSNKTATNGTPLSVIKTSGLEDLAYATLTSLGLFMNDYRYPVSPNISDCIYYLNSEFSSFLPMSFDIRDFMKHNLTKEEFAEWDDTFHKAVPYSVHPAKTWDSMYNYTFSGNLDFNDFSLTDENYGGVSMFVPQKNYSRNQYKKSPNTLIFAYEWTHMVDWKLWGWDR